MNNQTTGDNSIQELLDWHREQNRKIAGLVPDHLNIPHMTPFQHIGQYVAYLQEVNKTRCQGVMGRIFGHKLVGNYDRREEKGEYRVKNINPLDDIGDIIDAMKLRHSTYINSVCERCGMTVLKADKLDYIK